MKKIFIHISLAVLSATSMLCPIITHAQTATGSETTQGSLGKRYLGAGFAVNDSSNDPSHTYGTGVGVNVPVAGYLDVRAGYSYNWYKSDGLQYATYKFDAHSLSTDFVFYKKMAGGLKPFFSAGVGYVRRTLELVSNGSYIYFNNGSMNDDLGTWNVSLGIEIPLRWVALTPTITYDDDFEKGWNSSQSWSCGLQASSWISSQVGVTASVDYSEPKDGRYDIHVWTYAAGIQVKF